MQYLIFVSGPKFVGGLNMSPLFEKTNFMEQKLVMENCCLTSKNIVSSFVLKQFEYLHFQIILKIFREAFDFLYETGNFPKKTNIKNFKNIH